MLEVSSHFILLLIIFALIILLALISKLKTTIFVLVKPNIATNTSTV